MLHLHLVAYTEGSVQAYFCLAFSSQLWCRFHITACNYTSKEGLEGLKSWGRLAFPVPVTEAVTSAMSEGTGDSPVTVHSQGVSPQAEERSSCVSSPGIWGPLLWCHQKNHRHFSCTTLRKPGLFAPPFSGMGLHAMHSNFSLLCLNFPVQAIPK